MTTAWADIDEEFHCDRSVIATIEYTMKVKDRVSLAILNFLMHSEYLK